MKFMVRLHSIQPKYCFLCYCVSRRDVLIATVVTLQNRNFPWCKRHTSFRNSGSLLVGWENSNKRICYEFCQSVAHRPQILQPCIKAYKHYRHTKEQLFHEYHAVQNELTEVRYHLHTHITFREGGGTRGSVFGWGTLLCKAAGSNPNEVVLK
jgi:hypothetical protein